MCFCGSPQPKSVLIAKAAPDAARPNQTRVVIVATNALSDYDVVNFDLSKCGSSSLGDSKGCEVDSKGSEMNMEGTAMIDIHRTSASENCQKVVLSFPILTFADLIPSSFLQDIQSVILHLHAPLWTICLYAMICRVENSGRD